MQRGIYFMKKRYLPLLLLGITVTLSSCGPVTKAFLPKPTYNNSDAATTADSSSKQSSGRSDRNSKTSAKNSDLQTCTVDNVTFSVNKDWEPMDGYDGTFTIPDNNIVYQLQGISFLGSYTPEEVYQKLLDYYTDYYEVLSTDDSPVSCTTPDNVECSVGRIEMTKDSVLYSIDVLICPQKNTVVTFAAQCHKNDTLPVDLREITSTATFNIGTKDYVSGNTFIAADDSELCLSSDNSFIYYQSASDHEGAYCTGTYDVYYGQEAFDKLVSLEEYGLTEEELEETLASNMAGYKPGESSPADFFQDEDDYNEEDYYHVCKDTFYVVILHNEELVEPENQVSEMGYDTLYLGYYLPELEKLDLTNANTANPAEWTLQGKTN